MPIYKNIKTFLFSFSFFSFLLPQILLASASSRADSHAPIGVMGDHVHDAGEWMLSYRYMNMFMDGNRSGTDSVSTGEVLQQYMVAPTRMKMEMHMAGLMYAPSNRITLLAMVPYIRNSMDHVNRMGRTFNTETRGLGDISAGALIPILNRKSHKIHINAVMSLPTGSIDERDDTLVPDQLLPYPMQLGSGTYDLQPGLTYSGLCEKWSWGGQTRAVIRLGENNRDYTLGNRMIATIWGARNFMNWLSGSLRLSGESWGDIDGRDKDLNPIMVPTADPNRRAGDRIDFHLGFNLLGQHGWAQGHRIALEYTIPVYQRLDAFQLETDTQIILGWQKAY